jgi:hypothetical protein
LGGENVEMVLSLIRFSWEEEMWNFFMTEIGKYFKEEITAMIF